MLQAFVLVILTAACAVYTQLVFKARASALAGIAEASTPVHYLVAMLTDIWVLSGIAVSGLGIFTWLLAVRQADLTFVYPLMALVFLVVPLAAHLMFGEPLPPVRVLG